MRVMPFTLIFILLCILVVSIPAESEANYEYIYQNLSREVPVYEDKIITVEESYNATTESMNPSYQYTIEVFKEFKTEYYDGERIGVKVGSKEIKGWVNVQDKTLSQWFVPIGDRNFEEFGRCRKYEIEKGVCGEVDIDEIK